MRPAVPLLLAAVLAACAPSPAPIVLRPAQPVQTATGVDGRYRGTVRLVTANVATCPRSGPRVYQVQNGQVTLAYNAGPRQRVPLTADIGPDGRIQASDGTGSMEGQLRDGRLEVTIASSLCEHRWTMTRVD